MGKLIKDFWTYEYKKISEDEKRRYFGIVEVIEGEDLAQKRNLKKHETHIEKALRYTMQNKVLSHMSIQTYCTWLKDKPGREYSEQKYYPFVLEFESKKKSDYNEVVCETATYVNYLISELGVHKDDILIMLNNSRSLYVYVNPKIYCLKPDFELNRIYFEMFKQIKQELGFKYVDESIVASTYKIMKTPNCYYKGGYFVAITIEELMQLLVGTKTKADLTSERRDLNKEIPGQLSLQFIKLYNNAVKNVKSKVKIQDNKENSCKGCCGNCVKHLMQHMIEQGPRNYGLVSIGIYLKSIGYSKEQVKEELKKIASSWNHDENERNIDSKVNTIFRRNYKFSCSYAKAVYSELGIESLCKSCPYKEKSKKIEGMKIDADVVNELWNNGASTRHYIMYLELVKNNLLNTSFNPEDKGLNKRTLRELFRHTSKLNKSCSKSGDIYIKYNASKKIYSLPESFMKQSIHDLGDYLKHYLKIFVKGYKALEDKILMHISKERLMSELEYSEISGLLKFLKKLKDIGLLKEHKNSVFALYYQTYKVIEIQDNDQDSEVDQRHGAEDKSPAVNQAEFDLYEAVIGEQLSLNSELGFKRPLFRDNRYKNKRLKRGSP